MQVLPHAQLQSLESGYVVKGIRYAFINLNIFMLAQVHPFAAIAHR